MTEHAANGVYDGAAVTTWERGSSAAVIWKADGKHRGEQKPDLHLLGRICWLTLSFLP